MRYQQTERRTISSAWTPVYKFALPIICVGFLTLSALSRGPQALWFFLPFLIFGVVMIGMLVRPLRTVRIDDKAMYVSNCRKEIRVPFSEVDDVTEAIFMNNINPVTISFRNETEFGRKIVFLPTVRWFSFLDAHPIVDEIRDLIRRNDAL